MSTIKIFARILGVVLMLEVAVCATALAQADSTLNLSGTWEGETRVIPCVPKFTPMGRCNAVNRITFVIKQDGSSFRGKYKCANGTAVCRNANRTTSGKIVHGTLSGSTIAMRVILSGDLSSCIYNGQASSAKLSGTYRCYQGGGLNESGMWQVSRPGTEMPPLR